MLFADLPQQQASRREAAGEPRLREPRRDQLEWRAVDIDSLIGTDHVARMIWTYVEGLDLRELEDAIKSREGTAGHPATSPRLLLALWLFATSQGVGSARSLYRLCDSHDAYRWLCGGVSVNYHNLSDFRVDHPDLLDRLLKENVAALAHAGIIDLSILAQDGVRVRASAGAASFRRDETLAEHEAEAHELVQKLKRELHDDPAASDRRVRAARERAARECAERITAARQACAEIAVKRGQRNDNGKDSDKKPPRASTTDPQAHITDPQAHIMKMADGGFRPAYNVQVASVAGEQIVVAIDPGTSGSDRGLMRPMLEKIQASTGELPEHYLADGGFGSAKDIEWAHAEGVTVYCPPTKSKHGTDPFAPRDKDGPGVAAWRERMAGEQGKSIYKERSICECIHARWRNCDLVRLTVRGLKKVRAVVLLHALCNNVLQGYRMARASKLSHALAINILQGYRLAAL
jgi:transposase